MKRIIHKYNTWNEFFEGMLTIEEVIIEMDLVYKNTWTLLSESEARYKLYLSLLRGDVVEYQNADRNKYYYSISKEAIDEKL